jgi:hypothetical protein
MKQLCLAVIQSTGFGQRASYWFSLDYNVEAHDSRNKWRIWCFRKTRIRVTRNETVHNFQPNIALKRLQLDCDGQRATSHEKRRPDTGGQAKWAEEGGRTAAIQGHLLPVVRALTRFRTAGPIRPSTVRLSIALRCSSFLSRSCLASPAISAVLLPHVQLQNRVARYKWFGSLHYFISLSILTYILFLYPKWTMR